MISGSALLPLPPSLTSPSSLDALLLFLFLGPPPPPPPPLLCFLTCSTYPLRPVERALEVFQLRVTKVEATVIGKIWMFSDWKGEKRQKVKRKLCRIMVSARFSLE